MFYSFVSSPSFLVAFNHSSFGSTLVFDLKIIFMLDVEIVQAILPMSYKVLDCEEHSSLSSGLRNFHFETKLMFNTIPLLSLMSSYLPQYFIQYKYNGHPFDRSWTVILRQQIKTLVNQSL